jgi:hypothetical protein
MRGFADAASGKRSSRHREHIKNILSLQQNSV